MDLNFKAVDVPETTRVRKDNVFTPVVEDMIKNGGARAVEMPRKTDKDEAAIGTAVGLAQKAGRDLGVTVRKTVTAGEKAGTAILTIWVVEKITRERKPETATAEAK